MAEIIKEKFWSPNDSETTAKHSLLPSSPSFDEESYVQSMSNSVAPSTQSLSTIEKAISELAKGLTAPPSSYSFANTQLMPDQNASGILPWPGLNPNTLNKIATENVAPQLVIGMRIDDVLRYSQYSHHPWRPGWKLEMLAHDKTPSNEDRKDIIAARKYIENANTEDVSVLQRDTLRLDGFQHFLAKMVRDSYIYDGIAIWRKLSVGEKVLEFSIMPAGNIRLIDPNRGYMNDKSVFAVMLDQAGNVAKKASGEAITYTREQLVWYVRNPRTDPLIGGYGHPEIEMCAKLIGAYQNVLDLNYETFNKSGVPNGLMLLKGSTWTQKQVDTLMKMWRNLLTGISKRWSLPVLATPKDGEIEVIKMNDLTGTDVRYQDFLNMVAGGIATLFRFPVRRLGYRISGKGPDTTPLPEGATPLVDDDDPGLSPLLLHIEHIVNQYLLWPNFPSLKFVFCGKHPKEDAREYQIRVDAMTWAEARAEADLPGMDKLYEKITKSLGVESDEKADGEKRELLSMLMLAPLNPNLQGMFQAIVASFIKSKSDAALINEQAEQGVVGNQISGVRDPAKQSGHGNTPGVRRDSNSEKTSAGTK